MALTFPNKDPDEVLDYKVDWTARLSDGDTISSSTWIVPAGITKDSDTFSNTDTTIWLSGGTALEVYAMINRITTAGGRTMDQTVNITMENK